MTEQCLEFLVQKQTLLRVTRDRKLWKATNATSLTDTTHRRRREVLDSVLFFFQTDCPTKAEEPGLVLQIARKGDVSSCLSQEHWCQCNNLGNNFTEETSDSASLYICFSFLSSLERTSKFINVFCVLFFILSSQYVSREAD